MILPTASGVSNEGGRSPPLVLVPAVSWPWVPACGSLLEPPRRDDENAHKTRQKGGEMGEIQPKKREGRELTKDQLGSTRIVPASHRRPWPKAIMTSDEAMEPAEGQVRLNCSAGTVVVVDGNVVRQSPPSPALPAAAAAAVAPPVPPPALPFPADRAFNLDN